MSHSSGLEAVLADLAAGVIDTTEATRRIEALNDSTTATDPYDDPAPARDENPAGRPQRPSHPQERVAPAPPRPAGDRPSTAGQDDTSGSNRAAGWGRVRRLVIRSTGHLVRVVGDPSVSGAEAQGPHTLRRNGELLEVTSEGDIGPNLRGFSVINPPRSAEDLRRLGFGPELLVRVNPNVEVDAEITGGGLTTVRVPRLGRIRVTAGTANLNDVVVVRDALVQAGGARVRGPIGEGRSRVRVESGGLTVGLYPDANVSVTAHAQLGVVNWPAGAPKQLDEYVVGNGTARLDLNVVMGHVSVREEPAPESEPEDQESDRQWWEVWRH